MMTADELLRVREIRTKAEGGSASEVSHEDRQWILDLHRREGIPLEKEVFEGAQKSGFNVEGIKVKESD